MGEMFEPGLKEDMTVVWETSGELQARVERLETYLPTYIPSHHHNNLSLSMGNNTSIRRPTN